ncbi:MAG TPA: DUF2993 domain-containing protein [Firmicutes bacterium]|nr:DUF2993 domain-containing protein [Bacillota bacterium]
MGGILVAALVLYAASEALLPSLVSRAIERAVRDGLEGSPAVHVVVRSFPSFLMPMGHLDYISLDISTFPVKGLTVRRLFLEAREVRLDLAGVFSGQGVDLKGLDRATVTVILSQDDLNEYFQSRGGGLRFVRVNLSRGQATLIAEVPFLGRVLRASVDGHFRVDGRTRIRFEVDRARVERFLIPRLIQEGILGQLDLSVDLAGMPVPLTVHDVRVENGAIYVFGGKP